MKKIYWPDAVFWIAVGLITLFVVCCLSPGCMTEKNLPKHNDKFPIASASYAHKKFPPQEKTIVDTLYSSDTLYQEGPAVDTTVFCDTLFVYKSVSVKCPPNQIIHDTVKYTTTNWMIDGAATAEMELKLEKAVKEKQDANNKVLSLKDKLNWWKIAALITWGIIAVIISFKVAASLTVKKL